MPRNKSAKRASKRVPMTVHQMESEIFAAPAKLAVQLNKEINSLKQKENKFKNAFNKMSAQLKKSSARIKAADKLKHTSAGKKKLKKAKKSHQEIAKSQAVFNKQLQEIMQSLERTQHNHSKLIALGKHMSQFEKEWARNAKKNKVTKAKSKTSAKSPAMDQSQMESFESKMEPTMQEELAEITS